MCVINEKAEMQMHSHIDYTKILRQRQGLLMSFKVVIRKNNQLFAF